MLTKTQEKFCICLTGYLEQKFRVHYVRLYVPLPQRCIMHTNYSTKDPSILFKVLKSSWYSTRLNVTKTSIIHKHMVYLKKTWCKTTNTSYTGNYYSERLERLHGSIEIYTRLFLLLFVLKVYDKTICCCSERFLQVVKSVIGLLYLKHTIWQYYILYTDTNFCSCVFSLETLLQF